MLLQVLESDNAYFELGTDFRDLLGFRLVRAHGLEEISGGCLALRADTTAAETDPKGWVDTCEFALAKASPTAFRMHVDGESPRLDAQLTARGYHRHAETVFLSPVDKKPEPATVVLRPVTTWPEWTLSCLVERQSRRNGPAGEGDPLIWEELRRRKWITGRLRCYLVESAGAVCGTVSVFESSALMRIVDLSMLPGPARRDSVVATVHALWRLALESGSSAVAAMASGEMESFFRAAGLRAAGQRAEYSRTC